MLRPPSPLLPSWTPLPSPNPCRPLSSSFLLLFSVFGFMALRVQGFRVHANYMRKRQTHAAVM